MNINNIKPPKPQEQIDNYDQNDDRYLTPLEVNFNNDSYGLQSKPKYNEATV